ncbi:MAG: peptidylprolyl isomerase [Bacillota bacterium]|nr:peptidylprolyl isomerase [Bacillota bacterium]
MPDKKPLATIEMENGNQIMIELDPENAPNTVRNFIHLAQSNFFDGLTFHRVIPGFMIQGGCPRGKGTGGPGYNIKGEFAANGFNNSLKHTRGMVSMARAQHNDSAGCQFFITVADAGHLDGQYATFGRVMEGMDTADQIAAVDRDSFDKPNIEQKIKSITVETYGVAYQPPEKV